MRIDQTPPPTIYGPSSSQEAAWPPDIDKVRGELNDLTALFDKIVRKGINPIQAQDKAAILKQIETIENQLKGIMPSLPQDQKEYVQSILDNLNLLHEDAGKFLNWDDLLNTYYLISNSIAQIPASNTPIVPIDEITKNVDDLLQEMQKDKGKRFPFNHIRYYQEQFAKLSSEINNYLLHTNLPDADKKRLRECALTLNNFSTSGMTPYRWDNWIIDDHLIKATQDLIQKLKG